MDDNGDGLKELLQTATRGRSPQLQATRTSQREEKRDAEGARDGSSLVNMGSASASSLSNSLLATLLPVPPGGGVDRDGGSSSHGLGVKLIPSRSSSAGKLNPISLMGNGSGGGGSGAGIKVRSAVSNVSPAGGSRAASMTQSLQELHLDSVECSSVSISQVKQTGRPLGTLGGHGSLIAVTRHCMAYVLNEKKIRFIAQDNAAMGLMDGHEASRLPIVDIAWSRQGCADDAGAGLYAHPSQQLIASLSRGGEVCIGAVYAESNNSLVYEALSTTTFPELQPARGLVWNEASDDLPPLLAVFGSGPEVFLFSVQQPGVRSAALTVDLDSIQACRFGHNGTRLFIAGHNSILIASVESIEEAFTAQKIALSPGVQRIWLFNHAQGMFALASHADDRIQLLSLSGESGTEKSISVKLPSADAQQLFAVFDEITSVLCIGANDSTRLVCFHLEDLSNPILATGNWPNESGVISVFATSQLHAVLSAKGEAKRKAVDMFLYAYHRDSVKLHRLSIDWKQSKASKELDRLPSPSQEILRPRSALDVSKTSLPRLFDTSLSSGEMRRERGESRSEIETLLDQRKQQEALFNATAQGVQQSLSSIFGPSLEKELNRCIDRHLQPILDANLRRMEKKLHNTMESTLLSSLDRLPAPISQSVSAQMEDSLELALRTVVDNRLLPGISSVMTDLIGQLSANISQAIVDSSIEQYKLLMTEMTELRQTVIELQHRAFKLPSAQELAQTVSEEIRQTLSPLSPPPAVSAAPAPANQFSELNALLSAGKGPSALIKVLSMGNLELLDWLLPRLDVATVIEASEASPRVLLSLTQQLGADLQTLTETKLDWLAEIFTVFDVGCSGDVECVQQLPAVLDELFANLRVVFVENTTPALQKKIKLVMRLVRTAMTSL